MTTIDDLLPGITSFLGKVFEVLEDYRIDVSTKELDHVCYRVDSTERYEELKEVLAGLGTLLSEVMINQRPIAVFKLDKPISYGNRSIGVIELPAPKPGSAYAEGWEHAEFAMGEQDYITQFMSRSDVPWESKGMRNEVNPDYSLKEGGITIKFHRNTLEHVVIYEQKHLPQLGR